MSKVQTPYGEMPLSDKGYQSRFRDAETSYMELRLMIGRAKRHEIKYLDEIWFNLKGCIAHHIVKESQSPSQADKLTVTVNPGSTRPAFSGEFGDGVMDGGKNESLHSG